MKLGKLAPRHDPRTLQFDNYRGAALPAPPMVADWASKMTKPWGMMRNDRAGCCTCSAAGHMIQAWTVNASALTTISDDAVIAAYSAVSGYDPRTGANDRGAVMLDVLNYWRKTGIGGRKIAAYVKVNAKNHLQVMEAAYLFGGVYVGVALPLTAQDQINAGKPWDVPAGGAKGRGAPGSWGGHAISEVIYSAAGLEVVTWGKRQPMTWAFWDAYVDETYGVLSADWIGAAGQAPNGFDLAALTADLAAITGEPIPQPGPGPQPPQPPSQPFTGTVPPGATLTVANGLIMGVKAA